MAGPLGVSEVNCQRSESTDLSDVLVGRGDLGDDVAEIGECTHCVGHRDVVAVVAGDLAGAERVLLDASL